MTSTQWTWNMEHLGGAARELFAGGFVDQRSLFRALDQCGPQRRRFVDKKEGKLPMTKKPYSRRSLTAQRYPTPENPPVTRPKCPDWLNPVARGVFEELVDQLIATGVIVAPCDAHEAAMAATLTLDYRGAVDWKERHAISGRLDSLLTNLGAVPMARKRMDVKPPKPTAPSKTALLLMKGKL